jgi:hypothetical protein
MARVITGVAWADTAAQRFVRSWFNDPGIAASNTMSGSTTSTTSAQFDSTHLVEFLAWANEPVQLFSGGYGFNTTATGVLAMGFGVDVTATTVTGPEAVTQAASANLSNNLASAYALSSLSEGYHFVTPLARVTTATTGSISAVTVSCSTPGR